MFYLIGGPPKCGKTTLSKKLSKQLVIPWVSSDALQVVSRGYASKYLSKSEFARLYPHSAQKGKNNDETYSRITPEQIAANYIKQADATAEAIELFIMSELADGNSQIIEGYHITPQLTAQLIKKYGPDNFRVLFLVKTDEQKFVRNIKKSTTPNDWILAKTNDQTTFPKIAQMINLYGQYFITETEKYGFNLLEMDDAFNRQLTKAVKLLTSDL